MKLKVEQEDIDGARKHKALRCPIERAFDRQTKGVVGVVFSTYIYFWRGGVGEPRTAYKTPLSKRAVQFVNAFDSGEPCKPFSFTLDVPKKYTRGAVRGAK